VLGVRLGDLDQPLEHLRKNRSVNQRAPAGLVTDVGRADRHQVRDGKHGADDVLEDAHVPDANAAVALGVVSLFKKRNFLLSERLQPRNRTFAQCYEQGAQSVKSLLEVCLALILAKEHLLEVVSRLAELSQRGRAEVSATLAPKTQEGGDVDDRKENVDVGLLANGNHLVNEVAVEPAGDRLSKENVPEVLVGFRQDLPVVKIEGGEK